MKTKPLKVRVGAEMPTPNLGRKKGSGPNIRALLDLEDGSSLWDVTLSRARSIRAAATRHGIRVSIIQIPGTDLFAIRRIRDAH